MNKYAKKDSLKNLYLIRILLKIQIRLKNEIQAFYSECFCIMVFYC